MTVRTKYLGTRGGTVIASMVIVTATWAAYSNSFQGVFVYDDDPTIVTNMALRSLERPLVWPEDRIPTGLRRRTVVHFTLALDYARGGLDPSAYHTTNLVLHIVGALLLFDVVRMSLDRDGVQAALRDDRLLVASAVALLWSCHPLQTESVTYVVQRCESLMGLFFIATFWAVIRGARSHRANGWYAASVVFCGLGMFSKEVMLTAPPLLLLYDRMFLARSWRQLLRERGWVYGAMTIPAMLLVYRVLNPAPSSRVWAAPGRTPSRWAYVRTQPEVLLHYLRLSFWPRGLCFHYNWPPVVDSVRIGLAFLAHGVVLAVGLWSLRSHRWLTFLLLLFYVVLAPTSLTPLKNLAFEHRMYVPLATVVACFVLFVWWACSFIRDPNRRRLAFGCGTAMLTAALVTTTFARNRVYHDDLVFWRDVVEKAPENTVGWTGYGVALFDAGQLAEARASLERALELDPDNFVALMDLGLLQAQFEEYDEAEKSLERALTLEDPLARPHYVLGAIDTQSGRYREAVEHYEAAIARFPDYLTAHFNAAIAHQHLNQPGEAIHHYRRVVSLDMEHVDAHLALGFLLMATGEEQLGRRHLGEAVRLDPRQREQVRNILAAVQQRSARNGSPP